ncbi:hypothetical protein KKI24_30730 [bacterium]|nr:hypothetical protein [bacterium]
MISKKMMTTEYDRPVQKQRVATLAIVCLLGAYIWQIWCFADVFHLQDPTTLYQSTRSIVVECPIETPRILRNISQGAHDCISPEDLSAFAISKKQVLKVSGPEKAAAYHIDTTPPVRWATGFLSPDHQNLLFIPQTSLFAVKTALLFYD